MITNTITDTTRMLLITDIIEYVQKLEIKPVLLYFIV